MKRNSLIYAVTVVTVVTVVAAVTVVAVVTVVAEYMISVHFYCYTCFLIVMENSGRSLTFSSIMTALINPHGLPHILQVCLRVSRPHTCCLVAECSHCLV